MANTNRAPFPNGISKLPATNPFLGADGNPIDFVKTEDMQAAIDEISENIDGGAAATTYDSDAIDGGGAS